MVQVMLWHGLPLRGVGMCQPAAEFRMRHAGFEAPIEQRQGRCPFEAGCSQEQMQAFIVGVVHVQCKVF